MASVVIGGHSSSIGKTSLITGLIAGLRGLCWTAVKISLPSRIKKSARVFESGSPFEILEEANAEGERDTQRFLAAGAERALLIRVQASRLSELMPELTAIVESSPHCIIESNSILRYFRPDLYIVVLNFDVQDFKESAKKSLPQADAAVIIPSKRSTPSWSGVNPHLLEGIPRFHMGPTGVPADLIEYVKQRIDPFGH